ncbi:LytR/AlgR family response regulator transcription factor [Glacieibacterium megasporae]|uniref:LytR/AlgR family response regulator transcription factor n=1 Tax=Glacieibacterium megasporae TaxID=2835787 RepID=UPI0021048531|nr:LytTR family DNA-binding domain-containing protein [Polymorphobacter megasporae]
MSDAVLRTLIVDDEAVARERMKLQCAGVDGVEVVGTAGDGHAALEAIAALSPDLVLLDIAMPGLDGIAVAEAIGRLANRPAIVFCTAYDRHALEAFEVSAIDYLLKPVSRDRLGRAVDKARLFRSGPATVIERRWLDELWVPHRGAMIRIATDDLDRIEAERDYVRLWIGAASYLLLDAITRIEGRLNPETFIRLRRSVIVRRDFIASIRHEGAGVWSAQLVNGAAVRVGPTYLADLKASLKA